MKSRNLRHFINLLALSTLSHPLSTSLHAQGSLTPPPGAPAPTMKTLDQIEPRTPVNATTCPGDANSLYIITQPGSYYLTGNVTVPAGKHGIKVSTKGVTLDFGGFELTGANSPFYHGIAAGADMDGFTLKNGTLRGWGGYGCNAGSFLVGGTFENLTFRENFNGGLDAGFSARVTNCTALENGYVGIRASSGSVVSGCIAYWNKAAGISVGDNSTVQDCTAASTQSNNGSTNGTGISGGSRSVIVRCSATGNSEHGIFASDDTLVKDSTAGYNGGNGIHFHTINATGHHRAEACISNDNGSDGSGSGIFGVAYCAVVNCTTSGNATDGIVVGNDSVVHDCKASKNLSDGIEAGSRCRIENCSLTQNAADGIHAAGKSVIRGCLSSLNGTGSAGAGIHTTQSGNRLEGNETRDNKGHGLKCDAGVAGDFILRNSAFGNPVNYLLNSGATFAPVQNLATQTNPSANH